MRRCKKCGWQLRMDRNAPILRGRMTDQKFYAVPVRRKR